MYDIQKELDTIKTEHRFMEAGDPVPVNEMDAHDVHKKKHEKKLKALSNDNESVYKQRYIDLLKAHIELHDQYTQRI